MAWPPWPWRLAVLGLLIEIRPDPIAWLWIAAGVRAGGLAGLVTAQRVAMTAMPETVALFNGCGGMASLLVALGVALFDTGDTGMVALVSIAISVFVGTITFSGSIVAMAKLRGWLDTPGWTQSRLRHAVNIFLARALPGGSAAVAGGSVRAADLVAAGGLPACWGLA